MRRRHKHRNRNAGPVVTDSKNPLFDISHYRMTCEGKKRYDTDWQANFAGDETWEKSKHTVDLKHYKCPYCGFWHLTSRDG